MSIADVSEYLSGPFNEIEGWCEPHLWQAIEPLHAAQDKLGVTAPVAEIGVHHGKFLIGLMKTRGVATGNLAIDVFDLQQFNLDHSGSGNLEAFRANLTRCGYDDTALRVLRADSMTLGTSAQAALRREARGFSMFSIDGCHQAEHTVNDIRIAMELCVAEGVILVDDIFRADWPGVTEGVARLYLRDSPRFLPLAVICNKLILAHVSFHKTYLEQLVAHLQKHFPSTVLKGVNLFGQRMLAISPDLAQPLWTTLQVAA